MTLIQLFNTKPSGLIFKDLGSHQEKVDDRWQVKKKKM